MKRTLPGWLTRRPWLPAAALLAVSLLTGCASNPPAETPGTPATAAGGKTPDGSDGQQHTMKSGARKRHSTP